MHVCVLVCCMCIYGMRVCVLVLMHVHVCMRLCAHVCMFVLHACVCDVRVGSSYSDF